MALGQLPRPVEGGYALPNGWRLTPTGRHVVLPITSSISHPRRRKSLVALHCGHGPARAGGDRSASMEIRQKLPLKSAWLGLAWAPDGKTLYVSGGNATSRSNPTAAPVYAFGFAAGRLTEKHTREFQHRLPANALYWAGLVHHPTQPLLYAAHRGTQAARRACRGVRHSQRQSPGGVADRHSPLRRIVLNPAATRSSCPIGAGVRLR